MLFTNRGVNHAFLSEEKIALLEGDDKFNEQLYYHIGEPYRLDEYFFERDKRLQYLPLEFNKMPDFNNYEYIPPVFREKYEIAIWQISGKNVAKVKNKYFTPKVSNFIDSQSAFYLNYQFFTFSKYRFTMKENIVKLYLKWSLGLTARLL